MLLLFPMNSEGADNHRKILTFLSAEFARKDGRQCVGIDLCFSPGNGFKDDDLRKWSRADDPTLFDTFIHVEALATEIIKIAEDEVETRPAGKYRFFVRTHQHLGGRAIQSFALSPSYKGGDELALTAPGAANRTDVLANHAAQLMRINAQMYEGTIRVLGAQNQDMRQENAELRAENLALRRENDEAKSNKMDREFQIAMAAEKNARTNAGFQKLLQVASVITAKIGGPGGDPNEPSAMVVLIGDFGKSLRQDQTAALIKHVTEFMNVLDIGQKMMFLEIINPFMPQEAPNGNPASAGLGGSMLPSNGGTNGPAA